VRRQTGFLATLSVLLLSVSATLGAVPAQGERPPQPFFEDFLSGRVSLQGSPAPAGEQLIACINDCATGFASQPVKVGPEGSYIGLEVNPSDEGLIGQAVTFYLVNDFGRIKAVETWTFVGIFNFYTVDLTFTDPLPVPTPTPTVSPAPTVTPTASLPVPGDPAVTAIPRLALIIGAIAVVSGLALLLLARRRTL
tara:strand:- start:90 stop:674 length:585 start_codon:yes stop_codon:yes gene_type:complete